MKTLVSIADGADRLVGAVCKALILATTCILMVALGANVIARYALAQGGFPWVSEVPEQLFPWMIAAGIVLGVQHGAHIAVDFLLTSLGARVGRLLAVGIHLLVAGSYAVLLAVVLDTAEIAAIERSPLLGISRSWGYYAIAFASVGVMLGNFTIALRVMLFGTEALPQGSAEESPL